MIQILLTEYIELLEYKLQCLKVAKEKDSSWNYNIEGLEKEIVEIKELLNKG